MKKSKLLFTLIFINVFVNVNAQKVRRNFTLYGEAFGQGYVYGSLNLEEKVKDTYKGYQTAGASLIYMPERAGFGNGEYLGVGVNYNWVYGKKSHHFTTGIGTTLMLSDGGYINLTLHTMVLDFYLTPKLGYRYQKRNGRLFLTATLNAMVGISQSDPNVKEGLYIADFKTLDIARIFPWPGLGLGWNFKFY